MEGIWSWSKDQLLKELQVTEHTGLSTEDARRRVRQHGLNELQLKQGTPRIVLFARQFKSPLIYILVIAGIFALIENNRTDALIIAIVVLGNALIGFYQEFKAEKTMAKLRQILAPQAKVVRDGQEQKIAAKYLVVGDIILLEAGDRVPADARLMTAQNVRVNQASLTGESLPANKRVGTHDAKTALIDRANMVYASTLIVDGQAQALVTAVGMQTELGQITKEVAGLDDKPERLEHKINQFSQDLLLIIIIMAAATFALGLMRGIAAWEMIRLTMALLVSTVPEGLPVAITVALSVGLIRVARKQAVIRKLSAAETLGSVTTICVDKTGTLTHAQMMVEKFWAGGEEYVVTGEGYRLSGSFLQDGARIDIHKKPVARLALELSSLATMSTISNRDLKNDEAKQLTDPTETALAVVAAKAGFYAFKQEKLQPELLEIPFDQNDRFSASVHRLGRKNRYIVKGALERVLHLSSHYLTGQGEARRLVASTCQKLEDQATEYARNGYRVVALALLDRPGSEATSEKHIKQLTLVAIMAIADPIRHEAIRAVEIAEEAGLKVVMVTGDHILTARNIAEKMGILRGLKAMHAEDVTTANLSEVSVISRATPRQKLTLVGLFQKKNEIVAMTGDGVNDAPALKKADIGVAMGRSGTDVAVEAADMVLLNDSFGGIIAAIEQGRLIWENLRKLIFYLISTAFAEMLLTVTSLFAGLPLPLLPIQIIWLNLVTDGINSLPLTIEPAEKDLMKRPPKPVTAPLMDGSAYLRTIILAVTMTAVSFWLYRTYLDRGEEYARTVALLSMFFFQLLQVFNSRSATRSIFQLSVRSNPMIWAAFFCSTALTLLAVFWPTLSHLLHTTVVDAPTLLLIIVSSFSVIVVDELRKLVMRLAKAWAKTTQTWA